MYVKNKNHLSLYFFSENRCTSKINLPNSNFLVKIYVRHLYKKIFTINNMDYKECTFCLDDKDLDEFRERSDGTLYSICRDCEKNKKKFERNCKKVTENDIQLFLCKNCGIKREIDNFRKRSNGLYRTKCKICEKKDKKNTKMCNNCGKTLPFQSFRLRKHNNTYYSRCRTCEREQTRARRERNKKTPEEILEKKKKNDELLIKKIINETGISRPLAKKALSRYDNIIVSEFSHIIDVPNYIEERTLNHVIQLVKETQKKKISKGKRMKIEKKVSEYINNNKKKGLTIEEITQFREKCIETIPVEP